ncbi:MAG: DUF3149 domain-containing protein [Arenicellales bacterium]
MTLWTDLLFGNWIGIMSLIAVFGTLATGIFIITMAYRKSRPENDKKK